MCNEAVTWTVFETPIKISTEQVAELNKWPAGFLSGNNRSPMPLNDRLVTYYGITEDIPEEDQIPDDNLPDDYDEPIMNINLTDYTDTNETDISMTTMDSPSSTTQNLMIISIIFSSLLLF